MVKAAESRREEVEFRRNLAEIDPTTTKYLANSLENLGKDLSSLDRHEDALRADEEPVSLRRKLAEANHTVKKDLARSLHNLGVDLSNLGRHEDALRANEESISLLRKLAETDHTVKKDLASSLDIVVVRPTVIPVIMNISRLFSSFGHTPSRATTSWLHSLIPNE